MNNSIREIKLNFEVRINKKIEENTNLIQMIENISKQKKNLEDNQNILN